MADDVKAAKAVFEDEGKARLCTCWPHSGHAADALGCAKGASVLGCACWAPGSIW